ncbi:LLM class F420-dependent oxidoreductase [Streptomyces sp. NPDC014889]|uniref:LLM class F420-dependent oxidoreductase n=1 Tax=Streptomyces sp. NPDC014889 TaxID=3364928 RepID=UPI0037019041
MSDTTGPARPLPEAIGRYGIWSIGLRSENAARRGELAEAAAELEELGYGAVWLGGNSTARNAAPLIEATGRIVVATSIQSVWQQDATDSAAEFTALEATHPGRFVLGLGVSHGPRVQQYRKPYSTMVEYLDRLDELDRSGEGGVPAGRRALAALGPRMLRLARDRAAGAIPYLTTPDHTAQAREILGGTALLAPEFKVVLETDPARARAVAREYLGPYLELPNYTDNFLRLGFTDSDVTGGGSDRLIDAVFAWGEDSRIRERIEAFRAAGADHVALQVVTDGPRDALPREEWRRLASLLA